MYIVLFTDRFYPETRANAHLFFDLATSMARRGHRVRVVTRQLAEFLPEGAAEQLPQHEWVDGVEIVRVGTVISTVRTSVLARGLEQITLALRLALTEVRDERPDVVVVYSPPLPLVFACVLLRLARSVPFVLNLHDVYPQAAVELGLIRNPVVIRAARLLERIAYRLATKVVVPVEASRRLLLEKHGKPAESVHVIPNWVDTAGVRPGPRDNEMRRRWGLDGEFVVSYAGAIGHFQDLTAIVKAARRLQAETDLIFLLIGEGPTLHRWQEMAADLPNVRFLPLLERSEYFASLRASDVCLAALRPDLRSPAAPGKIQSIMSVGRPVVAVVPTDGAAAELVNSSGCGLVVDPSDDAGLAEVIVKLRDDPAWRTALGSQGRRYAEEHFDTGAAMTAYERVLTSVPHASKRPAEHEGT